PCGCLLGFYQLSGGHMVNSDSFLASGTFQATLVQLQCLENAVDDLLGETLASFSWWPMEEDGQNSSIFLTDTGQVKTNQHIGEHAPLCWGYEAHLFLPEPSSSPPAFGKRFLESFLVSCGIQLLDYQEIRLPEKDWLAENFLSFQPISVGSFYIYGTHHGDVTVPLGQKGLCLDAATAFGSGRHETTASCLQLLEYLATEAPFEKALDLGCGAGILAIAIAMLTSKPVWASDLDPEAVRVTTENSRLNGVGDLVYPLESVGLQAEALQAHMPFDVVVANILADPLKQLASPMASAVSPGGWLILSGILASQAEEIEQLYHEKQFQKVRVVQQQEWTTFLFKKF
ncbi:MAG: 50S ribosomal protein L11 methyltransferase, partial [Alphaproteobacteria bacterium]